MNYSRSGVLNPTQMMSGFSRINRANQFRFFARSERTKRRHAGIYSSADFRGGGADARDLKLSHNK
jgi:hypothetical protein